MGAAACSDGPRASHSPCLKFKKVEPFRIAFAVHLQMVVDFSWKVLKCWRENWKDGEVSS